MFHITCFTSSLLNKASLIFLHSTGAGGSLGAGWPEESVPYSNRLPGSKARLRTGETTRSIFGTKGGWRVQHDDFSIWWSNDPDGNGKWWFLYFSIWTWWFLHWFRSKKKGENHQPTLVDPLRTSAERIYTEPPTTRLANSCGSSGLHTWFDLKMGYTFPETASWVEDNENKPWKLGIPWDKPKYFKCLQPRTRIHASIFQPSEIEGHQSPAGSNTLRQEGYQMRMMPIILKLKIIGLKENLYS